MKKMISCILALILLMALTSPALASIEGEYTWNDFTITVSDVNDRLSVESDENTDDLDSVTVELSLPDSLMENRDLRGALIEQARLVDDQGASYESDAAMSRGNTVMLHFSLPAGTDLDMLTLAFHSENIFPIEYAIYDETYLLEGYLFDDDNDGNILVKFRQQGIVFLTDPDGNVLPNSHIISAIFETEGEEVEIWVDHGNILEDGIPVSSLSTTPVLHDLVFKLQNSTNPDKVTLINTAADEVIVTFYFKDVPPISAE